jgi:hypothetical protein
MATITWRRVDKPAPAVDHSRQSCQRLMRRPRVKHQLVDEAAERRQRILRERVAYVLWVMAQRME